MEYRQVQAAIVALAYRVEEWPDERFDDLLVGLHADLGVQPYRPEIDWEITRQLEQRYPQPGRFYHAEYPRNIVAEMMPRLSHKESVELLRAAADRIHRETGERECR